jgi:hypothetical protein
MSRSEGEYETSEAHCPNRPSAFTASTHSVSAARLALSLSVFSPFTSSTSASGSQSEEEIGSILRDAPREDVADFAIGLRPPPTCCHTQ